MALPSPALAMYLEPFKAAAGEGAALELKMRLLAGKLLSAAFWQALLFGSPDALVPSLDAVHALQLVSEKLGVPIAAGQTLGVLRAGQFRRLLRERFGPAAAEGTIAALWRSAPASPGVPQPAEDQSQLGPGPFPLGRAQPAWIRDLHDPDRGEREWLLDHGIG